MNIPVKNTNVLVKKNYTKKVIQIGEASSAEARAGRLRRVRNMANLSREKMCSSEGLNINTYKGWEIARYGGLPVDGAERVIRRVAHEHVVVTLEWLLHGQGAGPYVMPSAGSVELSSEDGARGVSFLEEIELFKRYFSHVLTTTVEDDGLAPWYRPGDVVAGVKKYGRDIEQYVGECCIVETGEGEILVRRIKRGSVQGKHTLVCTNMDTQVKKPVIYDAVLVSAAPIIRHYR
ncbi:MAG: hypothetical protein K0Q74_1433 [Gammaproteobacteria bacterium]|jgi:transcriptional regulator with XRE-family HTH domain|nr:hypothetical protein [Gammaproteobacteria bacterium]